MDRYRYFIFNQRSIVVLGILQMTCSTMCVVCGIMDGAFRKNTPLSSTRMPVWGGLAMALPGVLALFASQRKNPILVTAMVIAAILSCAAVVLVAAYSCQTLTYGEEDKEVFHQHDSPEVTFVLHRMVKAANATILLSCIVSSLLSALITYVGVRSLPCCGCYDARTGLEMLVPQSDPYSGTELVCTQQGGEQTLSNAPADSDGRSISYKQGNPHKLPPYSKLT